MAAREVIKTSRAAICFYADAGNCSVWIERASLAQISGAFSKTSFIFRQFSK